MAAVDQGDRKKRFIPGIYNYCDRWCERCSCAGRCPIPGYGKPGSSIPESVVRPGIWDAESETLTISIEIPCAAEEVKNISIMTSVEDFATYGRKLAQLETMVSAHDLARIAARYREHVASLLTRAFFSESQAKAEEIAMQRDIGMLSDREAKGLLFTLGECMEVLDRYHILIDDCIGRALIARTERDLPLHERMTSADPDGCCKAALLAMEKSTVAWKQLLDLLPFTEDKGLHGLALLDQLKNRALDEFPGAMEFIRPGFDDRTEQGDS